jgi:hypothetical protein
MVRVTPDDLSTVQPFDSSPESWSTIEWVKAHYTAWRAVHQMGVYGTSDMRLLMNAGAELSQRGVTFHESFPYYSGFEASPKLGK